ncbi:MAG TPA: SDR family oxidoreductase [Chloroflexota bacterium]|nr:SDR family oxidoreductase [Chloroflexota bacterium]
MRLAGKVAIVTGAGSGIGRAISLGFAREGARVVAADVDRGAAEATAAAAPESGAILPVPVDVTQAAAVQAMVQATVDAFGPPTVLVNNAAIQLHGQDGRCHEVDDAVWERTMAVNLLGPFLCTKHVLPQLIRAGGGSIVNLASPTAFDGKGAGYTAYATSKGGLITLTRVVATDYGAQGVRVNAIVPGATQTPLIAELLRDPQIRQRLSSLGPLGRLGQPEDVVPLAIYLASDESSFATGSLFFVDGGSVMA